MKSRSSSVAICLGLVRAAGSLAAKGHVQHAVAVEEHAEVRAELGPDGAVGEGLDHHVAADEPTAASAMALMRL